jgi:hypothetical protein
MIFPWTILMGIFTRNSFSYCGWASEILHHQKDALDGWNPINNGMFTTYYLDYLVIRISQPSTVATPKIWIGGPLLILLTWWMVLNMFQPEQHAGRCMMWFVGTSTCSWQIATHFHSKLNDLNFWKLAIFFPSKISKQNQKRAAFPIFGPLFLGVPRSSEQDVAQGARFKNEDFNCQAPGFRAGIFSDLEPRLSWSKETGSAYPAW